VWCYFGCRSPHFTYCCLNGRQLRAAGLIFRALAAARRRGDCTRACSRPLPGGWATSSNKGWRICVEAANSLDEMGSGMGAAALPVEKRCAYFERSPTPRRARDGVPVSALAGSAHGGAPPGTREQRALVLQQVDLVRRGKARRGGGGGGGAVCNTMLPGRGVS
jgi:hypothetical protein